MVFLDVGGDVDDDGGAGVGLAVDAAGAAEGDGAFAHAAKTEVIFTVGLEENRLNIKATAVVANDGLSTAVTDVNANAGIVSAGVVHNVGQSFLADAIKTAAHGWGKGTEVAANVEYEVEFGGLQDVGGITTQICFKLIGGQFGRPQVADRGANGASYLFGRS